MRCTDPEILSYLDFSCKYLPSLSFLFVVAPLKSAHLSFSLSVKQTPGSPDFDFELSPPSQTHEPNFGAAVSRCERGEPVHMLDRNELPGEAPWFSSSCFCNTRGQKNSSITKLRTPHDEDQFYRLLGGQGASRELKGYTNSKHLVFTGDRVLTGRYMHGT